MPFATMRITFGESVPLNEVEATLQLARMAVESLHGRERVQLEAAVSMDTASRQFSIDVSRSVGRTLALVFAGFVRREFGPEVVQIEHLLEQPRATAGAAR